MDRVFRKYESSILYFDSSDDRRELESNKQNAYFPTIECAQIKDGGKHKKVFFTNLYGYVELKTSTAFKDSKKELALSMYRKSLEKHQADEDGVGVKFVSTQTRIDSNDIEQDPELQATLNQNPSLKKENIYKFDIFNKHRIRYLELHKYIGEIKSDESLSREEKREVAIALAGCATQLMYLMFINKISNGDFHGNNIKVSFSKINTHEHKSIEHLESFDWGHSSLAENNDVMQTARYALKNGGNYFGIGALKRWQQTIEYYIVCVKQFFRIDASKDMEIITRRMIFADIFSILTNNDKEAYKLYRANSGVFIETFNELEQLAQLKIAKDINNKNQTIIVQEIFDRLFAHTINILQDITSETQYQNQ